MSRRGNGGFDGPPVGSDSRLRLVVVLHVRDGRRRDFDEFERRAEGIMARFGGIVERRIRLERVEGVSQPDEVHLVSFPDEASLERYRNDAEVRALAGLRSRVIEETVVWKEAARSADRA